MASQSQASTLFGHRSLRLCIQQRRAQRSRKTQCRYPSQEFSEFDDILTAFLPADIKIDSACFGVAGPVINQRCQTTNLPWLLDAEALKLKLNTPQVRLLNDLEAMALGMLYLSEHDLVELNPNAETQEGNIAVIAAGTGLGEAILYWDGTQYHPMATEGGHSDLASQNVQQDLLLLDIVQISIP